MTDIKVHYGVEIVNIMHDDLTGGAVRGWGWAPPTPHPPVVSVTTPVPVRALSSPAWVSRRQCQSLLGAGGGETCSMAVTRHTTPALLLSLLLNTIRGTNVPRDLVTGNNNTQVTRDYCPTLVITSQISHLRCKQSDINISPVWMLPTCRSDDLRSAGLSHSLDSARDVVIWKQIYFLPSKTWISSQGQTSPCWPTAEINHLLKLSPGDVNYHLLRCTFQFPLVAVCWCPASLCL